MIKHTERHIDVQTHTRTHMHTQTHKVRPTAPIGQRHGRAPRPKARKEPPWGADHTERALKTFITDVFRVFPELFWITDSVSMTN